jgi:hypothetical protein
MVYTHSTSSEDPSVAAMVIKCADGSIDADAQLNDDEISSEKYKADGLHTYIKSRAVDYFKNGNKGCASHIGVLTTAFIKFMKMMSIFSANAMWEKKATMTVDFFMTQLRNVYSLVHKDGLTLSGDLVSSMASFVEVCRKQKKDETEARKANPKPKKTKKDDADEVEDEEEDPENADADEPEPDADDAEADEEAETETKTKSAKKTTKPKATPAPKAAPAPKATPAKGKSTGTKATPAKGKTTGAKATPAKNAKKMVDSEPIEDTGDEFNDVDQEA